jgi:regulator of replication initiation timing
MTLEEQLKAILEDNDSINAENERLREICIGLENELAAAHRDAQLKPQTK